LLVLLHAFTNKAQALRPIEEAVARRLEKAGGDVVCYRPELPLSLFSRADPLKIADRQASEITALVEAQAAKGEPVTRIVFIGHSVGALLARKIYIIACGEGEEAPFEPEIEQRGGLPWAPLVERLVLLAGVNKGWRVSHHLGLGKAIVWTAGIALGAIIRLFTGSPLMILRSRAGSEFITNLRIQWLRMRRRDVPGKPNCGKAMVVQLLGSIDDFVSPADNIDLTTGRDFIYLDVPRSGHASIIDIDEAAPRGDPGQGPGEIRREHILLAATGTQEDLDEERVVPIDPDQLPQPNERIETVVFVVHGIRDGGYWTHKVARTVQKKSGEAALIATETSTYGYFPMLSFLLSRRRREKAEWLMDQYTDALALYPNARRMHFIGHSNGTYCLADALRRYACCHFDNVILAGSVVRSNYPWSTVMRGSRTAEHARRFGSVGRLLNIVATRDWVVAGFPNLFQFWLPIQRLGGAGHFGFSDAPGAVWQFSAPGGHGAGIQEPLWPTLAGFILGAEVRDEPPGNFAKRRNPVITLLGWLPFLAWIAAALLILVFGKLLWLGASSLACRLGEAAERCRAGLPELSELLAPSNLIALPADLVTWIVPVLMLLYGLLVIKLLRWV
jgi:hypothetical protein